MKLSCINYRPITPRLLTLVLLILADPVYANKFETIGGGVQGSTRLKVEYLQVFAYAAGAIFLVAGVLAILLQNRNALTLNYTMWRTSSVLFFLLSIAAFATALFIK